MNAVPQRSLQWNCETSSQSVKNQPYRVLCVDDDDDLTRVIKARLRRHQVEVTRAHSGKEGLKSAHSHRPNAIITDLNMPSGDGEFLIRRLKRRPSTASIPVVVISGVNDPSLQARVHCLGAAAILRKPVKFEELLAELVSHLDRSNTPHTPWDTAHVSAQQANESTKPTRRPTGLRLRIDAAENRMRPVLFGMR